MPFWFPPKSRLTETQEPKMNIQEKLDNRFAEVLEKAAGADASAEMSKAYAEIMDASQDIYQQNGFDTRADYLNSLAKDYGDVAHILADLLGPEEDFDGLVTALEDSDDEML